MNIDVNAEYYFVVFYNNVKHCIYMWHFTLFNMGSEGHNIALRNTMWKVRHHIEKNIKSNINLQQRRSSLFLGLYNGQRLKWYLFSCFVTVLAALPYTCIDFVHCLQYIFNLERIT